jgi:hypothetical protein
MVYYSYIQCYYKVTLVHLVCSRIFYVYVFSLHANIVSLYFILCVLSP